MKLTKKQIQSAYEAIKNYVHTYLDIRQLLGEEDDLCKKCLAYFERHKHKFNPDRNESIEAFAMAKADSCLKHEARAVARENRRKKEYADLCDLDRGETAERGRIQRLVEKALSKLTDSEFAIMVWDLYKSDEYMCSLRRLADVWELPWETFRRNKLEPARQSFAKAFGEVVGNPKLYAKLRAEVLAKAKGQN